MILLSTSRIRHLNNANGGIRVPDVRCVSGLHRSADPVDPQLLATSMKRRTKPATRPGDERDGQGDFPASVLRSTEDLGVLCENDGCPPVLEGQRQLGLCRLPEVLLKSGGARLSGGDYFEGDYSVYLLF